MKTIAGPNSGFVKRVAFALILEAFVILPNPTRAADPAASADLAFKGKPVWDWMAGFEPGRSVSSKPTEAEAEEAIHAIGPDAIPMILRYPRGSRSQRLEAIKQACSVFEADADGELLDALRSSDGVVRETALQVLPKRIAPAAMGDLVKAVDDSDRSIRTAGVRALLRLAPGHEETIRALIDVLQDPDRVSGTGEDAFTRDDAALALGRLGSKAKAAIPDLTKLLDDSDDLTRETAATALWKIDDSPKAIPVLTELLDTAQDYQTARRLMKVLGDIGPAAKSAVDVLKRKIEDPGVNFVPPGLKLEDLALETLARIDPAAAKESRKRLDQPAGANR